MNEEKQKKQMKALYITAAVTALLLPFIFGLIRFKGEHLFNRTDFLQFSWPIVLFAINLGFQKTGRIRKWFLLVVLWTCCITFSFVLLGLINGYALPWKDYVVNLLVFTPVHFLIGLLVGGFSWAFSD